MNKGELIDRLAAQTGLTRKEARKFIDSMISVITDALANNESVTITGFGKFEVRPYKRARSLDLRTQQLREHATAAMKDIARIPGFRYSEKAVDAFIASMIPQKVVPAFKPGKNLKAQVSKKHDVIGMHYKPKNFS